MKKIIVSVLLSTLAITMPVFAKETKTVETENLYTVMGVVCKTDLETDTVYVDCNATKLRTFSGVDDWFVGDYAVFLMDNKGTPHDDSDDKTLSITYSGYVNWIAPSETGVTIRNMDSLYEWNYYSYEENQIKKSLVDVNAREFYDHYLDMNTVTGYSATETGLMLYTESGDGYWWETGEVEYIGGK